MNYLPCPNGCIDNAMVAVHDKGIFVSWNCSICMTFLTDIEDDGSEEDDEDNQFDKYQDEKVQMF